MFVENLKIALRAIGANKLRSILTVLGVMIGVAAVIAVVSLVQGMQHKLSADLQSIGSNYIEIFPDAGEQRNSFLQKMPELTIDDATAVQKASPAIREFTPLFLPNVETKFGDARHRLQLYGVSSAYQDVFNHWVDRGRFFTPLDDETKKRICVIGVNAAEHLNMGDPIGKLIQIDGNGFTVVGTMEKKGGSFGRDQDDIVLIPFSTASTIWGSDNMRRLILAFQIAPNADLDLVKEQITEVLRTRHRLKKGEKDDFRILAQEEIVKLVSSALTTTSAVMGGVVGIALLVGGIGIMNIMLVSVTERTREIGIRKAIGARRRDVMLQFLIEAIALSWLGGGVGVAAGYLLANLARFALIKLVELPPVHTPLWAIVIAFSFCALLGVLFGFYPAAKASKLDPIEALRYE
jgi:putative ABC transport system permease protein